MISDRASPHDTLRQWLTLQGLGIHTDLSDAALLDAADAGIDTQLPVSLPVHTYVRSARATSHHSRIMTTA